MSNVTQNSVPDKPQTFKVITHYGYIPLLVDVDGSRWLHLPPFAEWLGLSLVRDIMPRVDTRPRYWGVKLIGGKQCLPADKANSFMGILRVEHAKGPMVAWLGNHCTHTLRNFTIPEVQTPMLTVEPEPVPVSFARPAPQFYAPVAPQGLITIQAAKIAGSEVNAVDGRELHGFLGVAKDFSDWMKVQIDRARLVEHRDYEIVAAPPERGVGNRGLRVEYALTLGSAKHISMMAGTDKGFEVRDYFIACEEKALNAVPRVDPMAILNDPAAMRGLLLGYTEKVLTLECKVQERDITIATLEPKAQGLDRIAANEGAHTITESAKILDQSPRKFFIRLQAEKYIYRQNGRWIAFQDRVTQGLMEHKFCTVQHDSGPEMDVAQPMITPKGIAKLAVLLAVA